MSDRNASPVRPTDFSPSTYVVPERPPLEPPPAPMQTNFVVPTDPLPDQVPPQADFSMLPDNVLHSGTVETLIGQNEDLMARLKVNIRRCATLERQLIDQTQAAADLRRINVSITAQIQILCEKEHVWKERADVAERDRSVARARLQLLEGFRRRALAWVKPRFKQATRAERALFAREAELSDAKARLHRALERARDLEANKARDQALLVDSYESQSSKLREELQALKAERAYLKERSDRLDEARRKLSEAENESILRDRQRRDLERKLSEDVGALQEEMSGYRVEAKRIAADLSETKRALEASESKRETSARQLARAEDQFESLRAVWSDAQAKAKALESRNEVLARINEELARRTREVRGDGRAGGRAEELQRIDALLTEIESGFARGARAAEAPGAAQAAPLAGALSGHPDASRAHQLDIVENQPPA